MASRARFAGKVVLVTGASSGIGRASALALGGEGARVVAAGRRRERLEQVVTEIRSAGGEAMVVMGDVRDEATCNKWVEQGVAKFGGLDGLVNAAGDTIYVGKARSLRDRLRNYLGAYGADPKTDALLDEVGRLEVIVTDSVVEALALENHLIKERGPKYNVLLRDDKNYPYLQLTTNELIGERNDIQELL